jgi:hypothetical protein
MLLLVKNYVSKQLIETELTGEQKIERVLVLWTVLPRWLRHKMWGRGRVRLDYNKLANTFNIQEVVIVKRNRNLPGLDDTYDFVDAPLLSNVKG